MTRSHHPHAKKSLGQHFLFDRDLLRRIALCAGPVAGRTVFEIGPGPGGLTSALLEANVERLIAVELDDRFAAELSSRPETASGKLVVHHGDAMAIDERAMIREADGTEPAMIIANLPYNVATPLVVRWIKAGAWRGDMALMFQKEVAQRICAEPDDDHYGRLAVLTAASMRAHIAIVLPPGAFRPPPKVDSAVVVMRPLAAEDRFNDLDAIESVTASAFGQRRKMLRVALKTLPGGVEALEASGIDPTRRAETLTQAEFRTLATAWRSVSGRQA